MTYPVLWLKVLDDIVRYQGKANSLTLEEFEAQFNAKYRLKGSGVIHDLCIALHKLGYVAYFASHTMKRIVLRPQILIDAISSIINDDPKLPDREDIPELVENVDQFQTLLEEYNDTGHLSRASMYFIWEYRKILLPDELEIFWRIFNEIGLDGGGMA